MSESPHESKITQHVVGQGNIFTGQGDIHVQACPFASSQSEDLRWLKALAESVKLTWVRDVLEKSMGQTEMIPLRKQALPEAVQLRSEHVLDEVRLTPERTLETPSRVAAPLPADKKIREIFEEAGRFLLILGEPGSGKTTTMLDLARSLLLAVADPLQPVPVVFKLSSWSNKYQALSNWLAEELRLRHHVSRTHAERWLADGRLILLLDGLDEVTQNARPACVEAIRNYEHPIPGMVVCSRLEEYKALPKKITLNAAICIHQLSLDQIETYVANMGTHLDGLRKAVINDESWQELLRSPLMLRVACLTYSNTPYEALEIAGGANLSDRRTAVFDAYIDNMFALKSSTGFRYSKQETLRWISWLARTMQDRSLSIFEIEQLQPIMLASKKSRLFYCFASRLLAGSGFFFPVPDLVTSGLIATAIICDSRAVESEAYSKKIKQKIVFYSFLHYVGVGVIASAVNAIIWQNSDLSFGVAVGSVLALCFGIRGGWRLASEDIQPIQGVSWSWGRAGIGLVAGFIVVVPAFLLGLLNVMRFVPKNSHIMWDGLMGNLRPLLFLSATIGFVGWLLFGLQRRFVARSFTPNIGIRRSLAYSLLAASLCGLFYPIWALALRLWTEVSVSSYSAYQWLGLAYIAGLCTGGLEAIRHLVLRLLLVCTGSTPLNYVRFLEYTTRLIFLRRAGGSYIFIHPTFMEHFAKRNNG